MRLQHLEIVGFKSFPDRSELSFEDGVTAIVGPNGCGKSNVVDAISWVLGEQSARSLRGDRMEDVIFSGSDGRRPTPTAEVRLKLVGVATSPAGPSTGNGGHAVTETAAGGNGHHEDDPRPWSPVRDIEVARRLYRSGESEYLIDGEPCRLRDVQDLLMDAGLGIKAYAVIEQGKIGQILSARPTERRQLIEEAAGVTKYKTRRRSAELKLEAAQQNLTRVDDIVYEVERQRAALKRQAARARRYRRLRDELRRWETVLFARRYRGLAHALRAEEAKLEAARTREAGAAARLSEIVSDLERFRLELVQVETDVIANREAAHAQELEIGRRQQQIAFERRQEGELEGAAADIRLELDGLQSRQGPAQRELSERREATAQVTVEVDAATAALAEEDARSVESHHQVDRLEHDVEAARDEVFAAVTAATTLKYAIEQAAATRARLAEELARLGVETRDLTVEFEATSRESAAAAEALEVAREKSAALGAARGVHESELASARIDRGWRAQELKAAEHRLASMTARLGSLEELDAARAGFGDAVRVVLTDAEGRVDHLGPVADYVQVDRRAERAVEACLGALLQCIVVRGPRDAVAGLALARERGAGRCGFLMLEAEAGLSPVSRTPPASVVPVTSVVGVTGPAADVIRRAIGEAWIAETFEHAAAAARSTTAPVVTLAGDVFLGPHVVHGGGSEGALGILGNKREIKELRERLDPERATVERLDQEAQGLDRTIAQAESAIAASDAEQHQQEKVLVGLELRQAHAQEERERLARKQALVESERHRVEEEIAAQEDREAEARESADRIEIAHQAAHDTLTLSQQGLTEARQGVEAAGARLAEAKAAYAALQERAGALGVEVGRLEEAFRELDGRREARGAELTRVEARQCEVRASATENERLLAQDIVSFESLREQVQRAEERVADVQDRCHAHEALLQEAQKGLDQLRADVSERQVARATAEADLSHLAAVCLDTLQITLDEVEVQLERLERDEGMSSDTVGGPPDSEADEADEAEGTAPSERTQEVLAPSDPTVGVPSTPEEIVADLRQRIDRLGPVNMMAVEQFDELEGRHRFLTEQRRDLLDAIATTTEAVKRIDQVTRERFSDAFAAISLLFQETFATLFGGGRAGLVMLDESDLLESGIDIVAQPPGKRLQSVQLLSGGEKALAAMGLMFAIFRYRPSPFCLLDEIDAPLDDANIGRFVEMLRGLQESTQFILITHNRKTMEIADRLYGVTMEEPGVSRLISLKLN